MITQCTAVLYLAKHETKSYWQVVFPQLNLRVSLLIDMTTAYLSLVTRAFPHEMPTVFVVITCGRRCSKSTRVHIERKGPLRLWYTHNLYATDLCHQLLLTFSGLLTETIVHLSEVAPAMWTLQCNSANRPQKNSVNQYQFEGDKTCLLVVKTVK